MIKHRLAGSRFAELLACLLFLILVYTSLTPRAKALTVPRGGFIDKGNTTVMRPLLTQTQIQAFVPAARGKFTFPAPYSTEGIRLTVPSDCGGADCVYSVGYAYWRNINNHVGSDTMFIFLGLNSSKGGTGPTLFSYNKVTDVVTKIGPLFDPANPLSAHSGESWYFSANKPTKIYINDATSRLRRFDVLAKTFETVFDISTKPDLFGRNKYIWQPSSSNDDKVHAATVADVATFKFLGCMAYKEDTKQFFYFPSRGIEFNECQIDKSGRWLLILEKLSTTTPDLDNRIIDLQTGTEKTLLDKKGAAGHYDTGFGYMVADDNWGSFPNTTRLWKFDQDMVQSSTQGTVVFYRAKGGSLFGGSLYKSTGAPQHISHENAKLGVAPEKQYACGSGAAKTNPPYANEVICFRLDTSNDTLVVAPMMTDMNATGGGDTYSKLPKGNLDVTGEYFIWTSNMGGSRQDAFIVKVPAHLLIGSSPLSSTPR
jgi:hypothetical protein